MGGAVRPKRSIILAALGWSALALNMTMLTACSTEKMATVGKESTAEVLTRIAPKLAHDELGSSLITDGAFKQTTSVHGQASMFATNWLTEQDGQFSDFVQVSVGQMGQKSWDVNLKSVSNSEAIKKGDWLFASYYVRAANRGESVNIRGFIEVSKPNWQMVSDLSTIAGDEWQRVTGFGRAPFDIPADSIIVSLHLANKKQVIDIADVQLAVLPDTLEKGQMPISALTYRGQEANAPWRAKADAMIKQHRMADFVVQLKDPQGKPVVGQTITVNQQRLGYDIGSFISPLLVNNSDVTPRYREWFNEFFNYATAPIYWADWGWEDPAKKQDYHATAQYFKDNNIPTRAHVLLYPGDKFSPQSLKDLKHDKAAFIAKVEAHIVEMVEFLKMYNINEYDVINELRDETDWTDIVGLETVAKWFKLVHELHPEAILYINENSILTDGGNNTVQHQHYFNTIKSLLEMGAPIHGIGMQGHFSGAVTPADELWQVLDHFSQFNLPIRITEYDVNHRDVDGQGQYDTDFYTAMYAHPATVGVTRWDFYELHMWRPLGGLIDDKHEYKPNALKLLHWLDEKKHPVEVRTNPRGEAIFNHHYGDYKIQLEGHDTPYVCQFTQANKTCEVVVR